jgi:hypothetical protein
VNVRTVKLELLRPGPPHNQLLSPLTQYIALCGDEPPETFHVPFEHYRILRRLQGLRPPRSPAEIEADLTELREDVVGMLCGIRCLATSLAQAHGDGAEVIELELVLSASELSLIPFEVAFYPGSPTRELAHREVIVMRRSRRVPRGLLRWKRRPRVLLVAASLPDYEPVPIEDHVGALREALAPWLTYFDGETDQRRILDELEKFVTVLPNASELSIQEAIKAGADAGQPYTHVHILAHGGEIAEDDAEVGDITFREPRFGLVLHDPRDVNRRDTLNGRRLFSALAGSDPHCQRRLPQVVTIASCDSGNVGGIVVPGASVAHDVHDGGIPLVVAAQFPLTYHGSVVFVRRLYERLLEGDDPRCALRETRRAMHASAARRARGVDWAAVVQYGALPVDLDKHVYDATFRALRQRIDAAMSSVDPLVLPTSKGNLSEAWKKAREGIIRLEPYRSRDAHVSRYIARVHLRWAFILRFWQEEHAEEYARFRSIITSAAAATPSTPEHCMREFRDGLRQYYRDRHRPTALVESLVGDFLVGDPISHNHVVTAITECREQLQATISADARRKMERALIDLFIIAPHVGVPRLDASALTALDGSIATAVAETGDGTNWFQAVFDRQFAVTSPKDFEHFGYRRWVRRIIELSQQRDAASVLERARAIDEFLAKREVPLVFRAVVDWIEQPDGGQRTIAT